MKKQFYRFQPQPAAAPAPEALLSDSISGIVENIVYRSDETGYTVCAVKPDQQKDTITVVGSCPAVWTGETIQATGKWVRHKQHGFQFQADSMTCVAPTSLKGIEKYLAGGLIRGVGKVMAERIVKTFGLDTLRVIDGESARLEDVPGIGAHRRRMIKESWDENKSVRDIMVFLQGHGVGTAQANRIYRQYGADSIALITANPYRLCHEVWGIGFKTADKVAMSIGIPKESDARADAGIVYILQTLTDEGHCFCPDDDLVDMTERLLEIPSEVLRRAVLRQTANRALVNDGGRIYLTHLYQAEVGVADRIHRLQNTPLSFRPIVVDKAVPWAEERMKIHFAPAQNDALCMALSNKVSIITGGPGVGKTTIIRALVDVFGARQLTVSLAAPTGRAAKRMEEATRKDARTIHRMLKFNPQTGQFMYGPSSPFPSDVFILDEVSMIDLLLMQAFLNALPDTSILVLVGDVDQLPSVGPGNVLRDLIHSGAVPCTRLETIFRQQTGGWIVQNAHRVNHGEDLVLPEGDDESDFYFLSCPEPDDVIQKTVQLVTHQIPRKFGFDPLTEIQVLTPMRKNQLGADNLNAVLQEAMNPRGPSVQRYGRIYRLRDRVMQTRNNYDKNVYNGDIGIIRKVDIEEQRITVDFDGWPVPYDLTELDELMHAYACSVHKAQGSEYPAVVVLIATQHFKLLQRNLLYTAITRGRKLVCLVGTSKAVHIAIRNNQIHERKTGLKERLTAPSL